MTFRSATFAGLAVLFLFATETLSAQTRVGDWQFQVDGKGTAFERRRALTPAQPFTSREPEAILAVRRMGPNEPLDLIVTATFDEEKQECDHRDWEFAIDKSKLAVTEYSIGPATVVLRASDSTKRDDLWKLLRTGSQLAVRVNQKCGWFFGPSHVLVHTFSLRGSSATINFVSAEDN